MEIKKINLDRTKLTTSYIEQKQDFNTVLNGVKISKTPTWKSPWFYGAVGLSTVAITALSLSNFNIENQKHEKKTTLKNEKIQMAGILPVKMNIQAPVEQKMPITKTSDQKKKIEVILPLETETTVSLNDPESEVKSTEIPKNHSGLPSINGVSSGRMKISVFQLSDVIESNSNCTIVSYTVQYYNGKDDILVSINGNQLPKNIVREIVENNLGQMVFFTDLKGIDENGKLKLLPAINIQLVN